MAYIGKSPVNGFFAKQDLTTDGSTTTFTLDFTISSTSSIIVSVGGVIQEPDTAYTLSGGNTSIVFSEAPASTADTYIQYLGSAIVQTITDINGTELVLDVDADTTITADTDDQIDFKLGGSDVIAFKTTGIHLPDGEKYVAGTGDDLQLYHDGTNSYLANAVGALKVATETSGIAVTIGHTTSEVTFGDNVTVTGNLTIGGTTNFGDFNITNVGSIALDTITNDGTDITLDSSGDIILDAGGNTIFLKDTGTTFGSLDNSSSNLIIKSGTTTAATFSGANVTLAGTVGSGNITSTGTVQGTTITATTAFVPDASDGAALGTSALEFSDLFLADAAVINFGDDQDVTLTHVEDTGVLLNSTRKIQFNDASQFIHGSSATVLSLGATDEIDLTATAIDINGTCDVSGAFTAGSTIVATSTIQGTTITATTAFVPDASDGAALGTSALEFSDLFLADAAVINFGDDQDVTLTHVEDTGLLLSGTNVIQFNDASQNIGAPSNAILDINATDEIELNATLVDVNANLDVSGTITSGGVITGTAFTAGSAVLAEAELEKLDGITNGAGAANKALVLDGSADVASGLRNLTASGTLQGTTITATTAFVPDASGGADLGTTALEFNDAFFNDSAVINFGDDQDTTLTHTDGTGLTLNSTNKICFNDASQFVQGSSATVLSIGATDEIDLTATAIDINGTCDISGTFSLAGTNVTATAAEVNYSDLATLGTSAASKVLSADANNLTKITGGVYLEEDTLSFDATQDWDVRASPVAKVTLTANVTFDAPSNPTTGQYIAIVCIQDGTGSRTIAWNAVFEFTGDVAPTATTTASKGDLFTFRYNGSKWLEVGRNLNLTLS